VPPKTFFPFWVIAILPALATFLAYLPLGRNGFVNWDDGETILRNFPIHSFSPASLKWIFTNTGQGYWVPLTWISLDLDYHLGGLNPQIYHWESLVLHLLNTTLVFLLAQRIFNLS
jgi:protein O-mannosyl-transferase